MMAPGVPQIMEEFGSSNKTEATFVVSIFILGFAFGPLFIAPLSELYGRIFERKAKRLRQETGNDLYQPRTKKKGTARELFLAAIIRPTRMFCLSFIVMPMCVYLAVVYDIFYILLTTFTYVYEDAYGFSSIGAGLSFIPGGIGNILGLAYVGVLSDNLIKKLKAQGLEHQPEQRLHPIISEPDGCRNYRSRDLQCEYGTDSDTEHNFGSVKGRRQAKQKGRSGSRSGGLMTPFTDGSYSAEDDSGNLQSSNMSEAVVQETKGMRSELHHMEPDWSEFMFGSPQDISSTPTNTRDFSHDTTFDSTVSMDQVLNSPRSLLTSPPLESMLDDDIYLQDSFPFPQSMIPNSGNWPARTEQLHDHGSSDDRISSCQCSITPMETLEAFTINVSSKHSTSKINTGSKGSYIKV
jgi:hypothetical protein